jgi:heme-degrading monooxygenase HmoA
MVTRTWRGSTRAADADRYLAYMQRTGFKALRETAGNLAVACLRRITDDRAEFVVVSLWRSRDDIQAFAGADIERAVFYPEDERFLVDRDLHVTHYDVVFSEGVPPVPEPA